MILISKPLIRINLLVFFLIFLVQRSSANVNAIDFSKINYSKKSQKKVEFLRSNDSLFNHYVHDWTYDMPQKEVTETLSSLYKELDKLPEKNIETELLLGDIAHYMFNLDDETYNEKAVDHYKQAITLAPNDYRGYWFLGNHYALSANMQLSLQSYKTAMQYLPAPPSTSLFWADYAIACSYANMPGNATYAAHQASIIEGKRTNIEDQIFIINNNSLRTLHSDTTIDAKEMWSVNGKQGNKLLLFNRLLGARIVIDSTWGVQLTDYKNWSSYITVKPHAAIAKSGQSVSYSISLLAQVPDSRETLQQFLDKFTPDTKFKKPVTFTVGGIKNCIGYEIQAPSFYPQNGGGHSYLIAVERKQPEFPGKALEDPLDLSKSDDKSPVNYYLAPAIYNRINAKLYYYILLDSSEDIHDESLAVFKGFLDNLTLE
jgi:tetratricopeptide (TPR) repeat protein